MGGTLRPPLRSRRPDGTLLVQKSAARHDERTRDDHQCERSKKEENAQHGQSTSGQCALTNINPHRLHLDVHTFGVTLLGKSTGACLQSAAKPLGAGQMRQTCDLGHLDDGTLLRRGVGMMRHF